VSRTLALRTRITLGYVAALLVVLGAFAVGVDVFFASEAYTRLDQRLHDDYERLEHALAIDRNGSVYLDPPLHEETTPEERLVVEAWEDAGPRLLWRHGAPAGLADLPPPADRRHASFALADGARVRVHEGVEHPGGGPLRLRVARSEGAVRAQIARLRVALAIGWAAGALLAGLAAHWLARRALAPLAAMAARAARIGAESLHERLPLANPDDELGRLGAAFNQTLERLADSFARLRQFTADASHELRTPLTALRATGEVALAQPRPERDYREVIGSMLEEADRLARLVDSLLLLARADAGQVQLTLAADDLGGLARGVAAQLAALAEERNQQVTIDAAAPVPVAVDAPILRRAILNLLDNAIRHGPAGSEIRLRAAADHGQGVLEVRDAGPGIAPEHLPRIFDRFYRVDPSRARADGGSGLGLAIAKWSAAIHGGTIDVATAPGGGTTFRLRLPLRGDE
jgi:heavy metal sensor kinase